MATSTVTLRCSCGSTDFKRPANPQPHDKVTCARCGAIGEYGQIMEAAKKQIVDKVAGDFRKAFKGIKGFKLK